MKTLRVGSIIHLFAAIHVIVTLSCRIVGIGDSMLLTLLTMAMTVIVCFKRGASVEFTAANVVIMNIIGYFLGTGCARLLSLATDSTLLMHAVATFITTEILGWSIIVMTKLFRTVRKKASWTPRIRWLVLAIATIFLLRFAYNEIISSRYFSAESSYRIIGMLMNNSVAILFMLALNLIFIRYIRKSNPVNNPYVKTAVFTVFVLAMSLGTTLIAGYNLPFSFNRTFTTDEFLLLFSTALLVEICLYCIIYVTDYAFSARSSMYREMAKAHHAQYQYQKLKQQVNPHFLFNSLNILDCLVCEHKDEQASSYIHKLAGIYRYMLQNEDETLVPLKKETDFIMMYADLMKVRFQDGFRLDIDIPEQYMEYKVIPCSVQMLVENAIKHNIVSKDNILEISVSSADGQVLTVTNSMNPKLSEKGSTGIGLANIRQRYKDLIGRDITVSDSGGFYRVTIPLVAQASRSWNGTTVPDTNNLIIIPQK